MSELGISKDFLYYFFWFMIGVVALTNYWIGIYFVIQSIQRLAENQSKE